MPMYGGSMMKPVQGRLRCMLTQREGSDIVYYRMVWYLSQGRNRCMATDGGVSDFEALQDSCVFVYA